MTRIFSGLVQKGRGPEAEVEFEKLLGAIHVKSAMAELSKSDRGDESDSVKFSELLFARHFKGTISLSVTFELMASMYFPLHNCLIISIFCSGFHGIYPFCFSTAIWHKRRFLFLFYRF